MPSLTPVEMTKQNYFKLISLLKMAIFHTKYASKLRIEHILNLTRLSRWLSTFQHYSVSF